MRPNVIGPFSFRAHKNLRPLSLWQHQRVRFSLRGSWWRAVLVVLLLHFTLSAKAHGETRHVLMLSSSERPFAPQSGFADALMRELIGSSGEPIYFVEVSVQAARPSAEAPDVSTAFDHLKAFATANC